jgi:hypothetical protein
MSMLDTLKKLPEDKKKMISAGIAFILTCIIAISWFAFVPKKNNNSWDPGSILDDSQINSFKASVQKSLDNFNAMKDQLFGTTSTSTNASSTDPISTTTSTTTNN